MLRRGFPHTINIPSNALLENVKHCGGLSELIQDYFTDELMNDVTYSKFNVQADTMDPSLSNSTPMDPLNAADSSLCMCRLSSLACLDCLTSVRSHHLPVLFGASTAVSLQTQSVFRTQ